MQASEVERPAMAAEARRERRQGAGGEEEGDRGDRAHTEPLRIGLYHSFPALSIPILEVHLLNTGQAGDCNNARTARTGYRTE